MRENTKNMFHDVFYSTVCETYKFYVWLPFFSRSLIIYCNLQPYGDLAKAPDEGEEARCSCEDFHRTIDSSRSESTYLLTRY
jgi:hypothetical protein